MRASTGNYFYFRELYVGLPWELYTRADISFCKRYLTSPVHCCTQVNFRLMMRLASRGRYGGSQWNPMRRPTGASLGPRGIFHGNSCGTPRHATAYHGIPWAPARTIGITRGNPWDTVNPWYPTGTLRSPVGTPPKNTIMLSE